MGKIKIKFSHQMFFFLMVVTLLEPKESQFERDSTAIPSILLATLIFEIKPVNPDLLSNAQDKRYT